MGIIKWNPVGEGMEDDEQDLPQDIDTPDDRDTHAPRSKSILRGIVIPPGATITPGRVHLPDAAAQPAGRPEEAPGSAPLASEASSQAPAALDDRSAKAIKEKAYQEGKDAGYQEGTAEAEKKLVDKVDEVFSLIDETVREKNKILEGAKDEILRLALRVAEKIVKAEIAANKQLLLNIVSEALEKLTSTDKVIIRANPEDVPILKENMDYFKTKIPGIRNVMVKDDKTVDQGGIFLETDLGYVDATLAVKLELVEKAWGQVGIS